jgi:hypothetical protein
LYAAAVVYGLQIISVFVILVVVLMRSPGRVVRIRPSYSQGDRLCGLVDRVLGYRSAGPGSIPGTTRKKSSGFGTEFTQPSEYN